MKKPWMPFLLFIIPISLGLSGCIFFGHSTHYNHDDDYDDFVTFEPYGYVEMEDPEQYELYYLGTYDDVDYDVLCQEAHGANYLAFLIAGEEDDGYVCYEACPAYETTMGMCETVDNIHYGMIDINTIYFCDNVDGVLIYIPVQYQHCNHTCTAELDACD